MNYESTFVVSPELSVDKVEELTARVTKIIEEAKGTVKAVQQLGKKKLAYPVNKSREGSYVYMEFSGGDFVVESLERFFKFSDSVIRFLTVKAEKKKPLKPSVQSEQVVENPTMEAKNDPTK